MLNRRHFVAAATAIATLVPAIVQAQAVGSPVVVEETTPVSGQGVSDDPNEMIRWMAFEGATVVTVPATRQVLIRELTGAIDLGYFTHNERTYPRGDSLETIHSYRITPLGRAVGHKLNLGEDGEVFMTTVGEKLPTASEEGDDVLNLAARGYVRPVPGSLAWEPTPYGMMMMRAGN